MNNLICAECGKLQQNKEVPYHYKNHVFYITQPDQSCESCNNTLINSAINKRVLTKIQEEKARINGLLPPNEIRKIRRKLKLTQKDASLMFGGGINAFNRYEGGVNPIPKPLSLLLTLLDKYPEKLDELKGEIEV